MLRTAAALALALTLAACVTTNAVRLGSGPVRAPVADSTGRTLDVTRSEALWHIYRGPAAIVRRDDWIDRASLATPVDYTLLGIDLSDALERQGNANRARDIRGQSVAIIKAARLEQIFGIGPASH